MKIAKLNSYLFLTITMQTAWKMFEDLDMRTAYKTKQFLKKLLDSPKDNTESFKMFEIYKINSKYCSGEYHDQNRRAFRTCHGNT